MLLPRHLDSISELQLFRLNLYDKESGKDNVYRCMCLLPPPPIQFPIALALIYMLPNSFAKFTNF